MKLNLNKAVASALGVFLIGPAAQAQTVTPAQWLASQPKPAYKAGHTLPRLTRYAYQIPIDVTKELTERWGYALQLHEGYLDQEVVNRLDDPSSREARIAALTLSDPVKYPLFITVSRRMPGVGEVVDSAWTRNASGQILTGSLSSPDGTPWSAGEEAVYSTEAPDSVWALAGEYRAVGLRALVARGVPVNIVLNGGEYGMGHVGLGDGAGPIWGLDPVHWAAVNATIWSGGRNGHCSAKKANSERIIADAVRAAAPQRSLYVYYAAGGRALRNDFWGSDFYGGYWEHHRGISDIPSSESYYNHYNTGFTGARDVLTQALNAASLEIASGNPLSYNWLTGGWERGDPARHLADITRWTGFLKCYATAGMIGGNVGAYGDNNVTLAASFPSNAPTYYLRDLIALSHVQALFSQVESLVRNSDLLPGPMKHSMGVTEPAYEFPTGDATARVLARKHRTQASWLITAWAADGADRNVRVAIPELGQLTVEARGCGSVYTATLSNNQVTLIRLDNEGATYTAVANGTPVVTTVDNTTQLPPASDCLLWLAADRGLTVDGAGKVSAWASQGSVALTLGQSLAARQPTVVANAISGRPALRFSNSSYWLENSAIGSAAGNAFIGTLNVYAVFTGATINGDNRVISATANGGDWETGKGFKLTDGIVSTAELKDGVLIKVTGGQIDTTLNAIRIGVMGAGYGGFSGDLAEILVYKGQSQQSSSLVTAYLKDKYNLRPSTVVNGSFEAYQVVGYQHSQYTPKTPGWINCGSIVQANGSTWGAANASDGTQTAVLQGAPGRLGNMSQTIELAAGTYTVGFKAARRWGQIQPVKLSIDGTQIGALITPTSDAFADCITASFTVTAGYHTLRLEATDGTGDKSTFIDQVTLKIITQVGDGSFESPVVTGLQYDPSGNAWTFENHSGIVANGGILGATHAPNGVQAGVLRGSGTGLGGISQTINFGAGGTYRLSFKAARSNGQIQPVKFSVDGIQVGSLITPTSDGFANYVSDSFTVTAGSHVLRLAASDGTGDNSTLIDQVILSERIYTTSLQGGGFETPAVSGIQNKYLQNPTGSGWDFTSKSYIQANGSTRNAAIAPEGIQTAQLKGSPGYLGAISQTVGFAAGTYNIRFKAARRLSQIQPVRVSIGGTQVGDLITPTSVSFESYSTSSSFTVAAGSHVVRLEATDDTGDTEGNSTFIDEVVIDLIGLTNPTNGGPEPLEAQTLKVMIGGGVANFVEYQQLLFESSSAILQTSEDMVDWRILSEEPTLRFSTQPNGPSTEKVTITPPNADTRRFFRFRYVK